MSGAVTVYAVFADGPEAERIGQAMVAAGHAACVNILPACHSIYRWQGAIETATETPALFKTTASRAQALIEAIAETHSYDVPAIVAWPIVATTAAYGRWIEEQTGADRDVVL